MDDMLARIWEHLIGRLTGPLTMRIYLQPTMATIFAVRDALRDVRAHRRPYFWRLINLPEERPALSRDGWKSIGKVFTLAIVLDVIYQWKVLHWFYPGEAINVALILAVIPYVLVRGLVNRFGQHWTRHDTSAPTQSTRPSA
jgi:hypothetical protein